MDDLKNMKITFKDLGVDFTEETSKKEYDQKTTTSEYDGKAEWDVRLSLGNGIGYYGFKCDFYFLGGKYLTHGCWE